MGVHAYVVGFCPPDEKWRKMVQVFESCKAAGIDPPTEVWRFFGDQDPGSSPGMEIDIKAHCKPWSDDCRDGFEIEVDKLPENVKTLRFVVSY